MKKIPLPKSLIRLGIWTIPVVCVMSVPFLLAYWQKPATVPEKTASSPHLPLPSQLPSPSPQISSSPPPSPVSLQPPRPKQAPSPKSSPKPLKSPVTSKTSSSAPKPPSQPSQTQQTAYRPSPPAESSPPLEIRVAILRDETSTTIGASAQASILDRNGRVLQTFSGSQGLGVYPDGGALQIDNGNFPPIVWLQPSQNGLVYVGDRWYRGKILLVSQGNSLLAVNYVDLEHYLYSVVGSEMHANAPTEALKAQAIAARSYALVHMIRPASDWYDLGNTQRWQVYKGINSEYNTGHQAVSATAGQILSYKGGVVESLYAATDEIVSRAHGGRGMSQTGAYELARQGYDHQEILSHYYPGISLAKLIISNQQ